MPYDITWGDSYVSFEYYGAVTSRDIVASNQEVYGDERFDELRWELVSFDRTESVEFDPANIRLIAYMDQAAALSNPRITVAFIGKTEIIKEVETAYSKIGVESSWATLHFDTRQEAVAYITQDES